MFFEPLTSMIFARHVSKSFVVAVLFWYATGCSHDATIHRYGGPSIEAEIVASDPNTLVITDKFDEAYEVPTRTVTSVDHPGVGWLYVGGIIAAIGVIPVVTVEGDAGAAFGGVYIGLGTVIAAIGGVPFIESKLNASGADLRPGVTLVPGTDMPVRRINEGRAPRGPKRRE
jgi:hypothetical protein